MCSPSVIVSCLVAVISISMVTASNPPYLVQLRTKSGRSFCGGALVSPSHVVTAGRCIYEQEKQDIEVVGGIGNDPELEQKIDIKDWVTPDEFNKISYHLVHPSMDIAVIELKTPMKGKNIQEIEMCSEPLKAEDSVTVVGWAKPDNSGGFSTTLVSLDIPLISREQCSAIQTQVTVADTVMCMSEPKSKVTCAGGFGGNPVVRNKKLCGISIWSPGCSVLPGMLTNIGLESIRQFIQSAM